MNNFRGSGLPKFKKYKPRKYGGQNYYSPKYINKKELQLILKEIFGNDEITLNKIIHIYGYHNIMILEGITINLKIDEVVSVREYDRQREIYCSKRTPDQFDELFNDIKVNGIQNGGRIRMNRLDDGNITVILGEGNHRLSILTQLGYEYMPVTFRYVDK